MITRLSHSTVCVLDQTSAKDFYVNKLGFEIKQEFPMGEDSFWWTVSPKDQPELQITLMPVKAGFLFSEDTASQFANLIKQGSFGFGVFECKDIYATYTELKEKGVVFKKEPKEEFYGIEALFSDDSGNWFSLVQHP